MPMNQTLEFIEKPAYISHICKKRAYECQGSIFILGCVIVLSLLWNAILAFLTVMRKNKLYFWNPETTRQNRHVWCKILNYKIYSFDLQLDLSSVKSKNECGHRMLRPKWPFKHMPHDTHAKFSFGDLIWPELGLELIEYMANYILPASFLGKSFGKVWTHSCY